MNFGLVDIKFGQYYRLIVKGEDVCAASFTTTLVNSYSRFLKEVQSRAFVIIVKGTNLTVLKSQTSGVQYVSRVISENISDEAASQQILDALQARYHSFSDRNRITLDFNAALREECQAIGAGYFYLNEEMGTPGTYMGVNLDGGILDKFVPVDMDHHLADTFLVRKLHYNAVLGRPEACAQRKWDRSI